MIARLWTAHATPAGAAAYADHLRAHVLPALNGVEGYAGAVLLQRPLGDAVEILVITWWQSLDAISRFAGTDHEEAVVADEAAAVLAWYDRRVRHYDLVVQNGAGGTGMPNRE